MYLIPQVSDFFSTLRSPPPPTAEKKQPSPFKGPSCEPSHSVPSAEKLVRGGVHETTETKVKMHELATNDSPIGKKQQPSTKTARAPSRRLESISREEESDSDERPESFILKASTLRARGCLGCHTTTTKLGKTIRDAKGMIAHANQCNAFNALPEQQQQQWLEELKSSERCLYCGQKYQRLLQHMKSCHKKN